MALMKKENRFVSQRCSNVQTDLIEITEDKMRLIFSKYIIKLQTTRDWVGYSGISVTILLSLLTCDFNKDFLGISHDIWYAIFVFGFIVSIVMLIISVINICRYRNLTEKMIAEIKNEEKRK